MARTFRLWGKKRGQRRTGSKLMGSLGEAAFYGALFLLGSLALAALVSSQLLYSTLETPYYSPLTFWLMLLVLGSFVVIGGGGVIWAALHAGASAERLSVLTQRAGEMEFLTEEQPSPRRFPMIPLDDDLTNSPGVVLKYRLPPVTAPVWKLAAAAGFCLTWSGVAAMLIVVAVNRSLARVSDWRLTLFSIVFLAVGVWAVYRFFRQMLAQTAVGPTSVEVSHHPLLPQGEYGAFLTQAGRLAFRSLEIVLVCEEETHYHQGTNLRTDTHTVWEQCLFRERNFVVKPERPFEHMCPFEIPAEAMHSFRSAHNAVNWKLVVRGRPRSWPPFERSFPVVVRPARAAEEAA